MPHFEQQNSHFPTSTNLQPPSQWMGHIIRPLMTMYKLADRCKTLIRVQLQPENALVPLLDALARVLYPLPKTTIFSSENKLLLCGG